MSYDMIFLPTPPAGPGVRAGRTKGRARPAVGNAGERETLIDQGGRGLRVMGHNQWDGKIKQIQYAQYKA
jgi:hypothetical protein